MRVLRNAARLFVLLTCQAIAKQTDSEEPAGDAVLVEMRPLLRIPDVLLNFLEELPVQWTVWFLHAGDNHQYVLEAVALQPYFASGRLQLRLLQHVAPRYLQAALAARNLNGTRGIRNTAFFNREHMKQVHWNDDFLLSVEYWQYFKAPLRLMFEIDTALCPNSGVSPRNFSQYTFTGSPWKRKMLFLCRNKFWFHCVGNSGLSLWRRDVMMRFVSNEKDFMGVWKALPKKWALDMWVSYIIQKKTSWKALNITEHEDVAPDNKAWRFGVESIYKGNYTPFGVHQWWTFMTLGSPVVNELFERCPAAEGLRNFTMFSLDGSNATI